MELCPKCKTALRIKESYMELTGDKDPNVKTKVYTVLTQICVNPQCDNYKQEVDKVYIEETVKESANA